MSVRGTGTTPNFSKHGSPVLEITKRHSYQSDHDQDRIKLLEAGIELLKKEIESKSNIDYEMYRMRDVVDSIEPIKGAKVD